MNATTLRTYRYPDSQEGARRFVKDHTEYQEEDILGVGKTTVAGSWRVATTDGHWISIYMAGYRNRKYNEFEKVAYGYV
jgi:hypothetical protein